MLAHELMDILPRPKVVNDSFIQIVVPFWPAASSHSHCNRLQQPATYFNRLQQTVTDCNKQHTCSSMSFTLQYTAIHYCILPNTATICNTLPHTATHWNALPQIATDCNRLQHTATHCNVPQHTATHGNALRSTAIDCNMLYTQSNWACSMLYTYTHMHTATHCDTLHQTATHYIPTATKHAVCCAWTHVHLVACNMGVKVCIYIYISINVYI